MSSNNSLLGLFEVPVSQLLVPPRESRLLREPDNIFVEKLKEKMVLDPSAPGATPMAVLCKDVRSIDQFNEKFLSVYKNEILGGLHTLIAKHKLKEEYPENSFFSKLLQKYSLVYQMNRHYDWHRGTILIPILP